MDLTGDGLNDYVLSNLELWCEGNPAVFSTGTLGFEPVKIVIGTADGQGYLAYDSDMIDLKLNANKQPPQLRIKTSGSECGVDTSKLSKMDHPVCWKKVVWQPQQRSFKEVRLKK